MPFPSLLLLLSKVIHKFQLSNPASPYRPLYGREEGVKISQSGTGSVLYLRNSPNSDNSGEYQCRANNTLGQTVEHFTVTHNGTYLCHVLYF